MLISEEALLGVKKEQSRIIRDTTPFRTMKVDRVLREDVDKTGNKRKVMRLTGLIQKADHLNENGRLYPYEVMKEAINELKAPVETRMVLGELDHPDDAKIHTENACILLTRCWMEDKNVFGQFEVLEGMPKGQMLKSLIEQGVTVSISSRGVGDIETDLMEDGNEVNKVLPGFRFVTFDAVLEPSVSGTALSIMEAKNRDKNRKLVSERIAKEKMLLKAVKEILG